MNATDRISAAFERLRPRFRGLPCVPCGGLGVVEAGTAIDTCVQCDGDGLRKIGDEPVTEWLADRLRHFAERGE